MSINIQTFITFSYELIPIKEKLQKQITIKMFRLLGHTHEHTHAQLTSEQLTLTLILARLLSIVVKCEYCDLRFLIHTFSCSSSHSHLASFSLFLFTPMSKHASDENFNMLSNWIDLEHSVLKIMSS